jgi:competence protein ComEC
MSTLASAPTPTPVAVAPRAAQPLFGGYVLVALVAAWVAGIALRQLDLLAGIPLLTWLGVALAGGGVALTSVLVSALVGPRASDRAATLWRLVLIAGMLMCATSLGAARTAQADPTNDPRSLALLASSGETLRVRGMVATEPDLRQGYRLLTLDCDAVSRDGGHTWQVAGGRVEAAWYGPDDWFAPAYGDTLELTGIIAPASASAPVGVVAQLTKAHGVIDARGGGNPVFAWLFQLRVMLAQAIQHALPEPEAALLIGILLGLKTPTLRARLPLFTATGTIHLVVPAGLKVSVLATIASTALRPLGR